MRALEIRRMKYEVLKIFAFKAIYIESDMYIEGEVYIYIRTRGRGAHGRSWLPGI